MFFKSPWAGLGWAGPTRGETRGGHRASPLTSDGPEVLKRRGKQQEVVLRILVM